MTDTEATNAGRHVKFESEASQIINHEVCFGNPPSLTDTEEDETDDIKACEDSDANIATPLMILPALCLSKSINQTFNGDPPSLTNAEDSDPEDSYAEDSEILPALCLSTIKNTSALYGDPPELTDAENSDAADDIEDCIQAVHEICGIGLRGGHAGKNHEAIIDKHLQLSNTNNDCFVNSVLQILSASDYATFLRTDVANILEGTSPQCYTITKLLSSLYSTETRDHISTATIRSHVALMSGKLYLDQGTQQDSEEFLCALEETLSEELSAVREFRNLRSNHWGKKQTRRLFRDNSKDGTCSTCGLYPSIAEEPFFILQLNIPHCASSISLASVIQSHFSESTNTDKIRCPHCCPHDGEGQRCTQQGICRGKEAVELCLLKDAPKFLFLQLLRFDGTVNKVLTHVKFDSELVLPNTDVYEPVAALNHSGLTSSAGHYLTYRRLDSGQWMLFDDTYNRPSSLQEANSPDNYILLFKKKEISPKSVHLHCSQENIQESNIERKGNKKTRCVFVGDDDIKSIEDKDQEGCKNLAGLSEMMQALSQDNCEDSIEEIQALSKHNYESSTPKLSALSQTYYGNSTVKFPVLSQTNKSNCEEENENHILDKKCRGCGKIMERLLRHLKSKKWELCMTKYTQEELKIHTLTLTSNRKLNYKEKNKEKIKEYHKEYRGKHNEKIKEYS